MSAPRGSPASKYLLVAAVSVAVALLAAPCAAFAPQSSAAGVELRSDSRPPSALHSSSTDGADPGLSRRQVGELA